MIALVIPVCPKCDRPMAQVRWREVEVDYCPECFGLWLDDGELEELLIRTDARPDDLLLSFQTAPGNPPKSMKGHLCPRCDATLREVSAAQNAAAKGEPLLVDRCPRGHGLWFDAGELKQLLEAFPPECATGGTVQALGDLLQPGRSAGPSS